jgi:hypothetical protein
MHSSGSRARNVDTLFFMHWWDRYRSHKKLGRTQYAKLVFLHLVGSACHVLHSGASVAQNINTLFFILEWDRYGFQKEHARTRYAKLAFLHPVWICGSHSAFRCVCGMKSMHYFSCSGGTRTYSTKSVSGHVTANLCFYIRWDLWVT